ncbi:LUD domain-containing protein [Ascidiimonas aurantiaca]|uniref:LUD domain-containing protein n=1 Tax=Ascidiimonas aurantiaca TaxID=1685432 RepID=UPI0030EF603C
MNLFKRIFGSKKNKDTTGRGHVARGKYMPEIRLPVDEKFTINFKKNGGKFIYCESIEEIADAFQNILKENTWKNSSVYCLDQDLRNKFKSFNLSFSNNSRSATFFLSGCENLVADVGGILVSSNQIGEQKLNELPDNFVVLATTSQLIDTIGEGLRRIKNESGKRIPTNITTIKHFNTIDEKDFLSYGSSSKNLYLLLLEDL